MNDDWLNLSAWSEFPRPIEDRCDRIAQHIEVSHEYRVHKYKGSYSFKACVAERDKTVAKLVPQSRYSAPMILVAFSPSLLQAEDFARQFDWRADEHIIMHKPFWVGRIPDELSVEDAAVRILNFLRQASPLGRTITL